MVYYKCTASGAVFNRTVRLVFTVSETLTIWSRAVVAVILGDEDLVGELLDGSASLVIFITKRLHTRLVNRVTELVAPKLNEAGTLVIAESLPEALEHI